MYEVDAPERDAPERDVPDIAVFDADPVVVDKGGDVTAASPAESFTIDDAVHGRTIGAEPDTCEASITAVINAGRDLCAAIEDVIASLNEVSRQHPPGIAQLEASVGMLARDPQQRRLIAATAIARYEHATMELRARVVRTLVDEGGLSLTAAARRLRISRQMVARLYRVGSETSSAHQLTAVSDLTTDV